MKVMSFNNSTEIVISEKTQWSEVSHHNQSDRERVHGHTISAVFSRLCWALLYSDLARTLERFSNEGITSGWCRLSSTMRIKPVIDLLSSMCDEEQSSFMLLSNAFVKVPHFRRFSDIVAEAFSFLHPMTIRSFELHQHLLIIFLSLSFNLSLYYFHSMRVKWLSRKVIRYVSFNRPLFYVSCTFQTIETITFPVGILPIDVR